MIDPAGATQTAPPVAGILPIPGRTAMDESGGSAHGPASLPAAGCGVGLGAGTGFEAEITCARLAASKIPSIAATISGVGSRTKYVYFIRARQRLLRRPP